MLEVNAEACEPRCCVKSTPLRARVHPHFGPDEVALREEPATSSFYRISTLRFDVLSSSALRECDVNAILTNTSAGDRRDIKIA